MSSKLICCPWAHSTKLTYKIRSIADLRSDDLHFQKIPFGEFLQPLKKYTIMKEIITKNRRQHEYYTLNTSFIGFTGGVLSGMQRFYNPVRVLL